MANTWETLDRGQQMELCRFYGAKTPEDHNRIAEHLSNDPRAVDKALRESGMITKDEQELDDTQPDEDTESDIEGGIDSALAEADVQETGKVASDIPPVRPGESIEEYIMRLAQRASLNAAA